MAIVFFGVVLLAIVAVTGVRGFLVMFVVGVGAAWIFAASQAPAEHARQQALYCAHPYQAATDKVVCEAATKPAAVAAAAAAAAAAYGSAECVAYRKSEAVRVAGLSAAERAKDFDSFFPLYPACVQDAHVTAR